MLVSEVLRPRLELLAVQFQFVSELNERVAETVRIEIGQSRPPKSLLEQRADRVGVRPGCAGEADGAKFSLRSLRNEGFRKDRIIRAELFSHAQEIHPIDDDLLDVCADGEEPRRE